MASILSSFRRLIWGSPSLRPGIPDPKALQPGIRIPPGAFSAVPDGARPIARLSPTLAALDKSSGGLVQPRAVIVDGSWDQELAQTAGDVPSDGDTRRVISDAREPRDFKLADGTIVTIWVPTRPWSALCRLKLDFGDGLPKEGTGSIIGPRTILTAAHNLYADGQCVVSITVVPGQFREGDRPFGKKSTNSFAFHAGYQSEDEDTAAQFDYGVVFLEDDTLTSLVGWSFPFQPIEDWRWEAPDKLGWINISGFPENSEGCLFWGKGKSKKGLDDHVINGNVILHDVDTTPGQSGAPIYWVNGDDYRVLGIHTEYLDVKGLNSGVRITDTIKGHLQRWVDEPGSDQGATEL
jgi:V8-like Glu-specific endopeptidase